MSPLISTKNPQSVYDRYARAQNGRLALDASTFIWAFLPIFSGFYPALKLGVFQQASKNVVLAQIENDLLTMADENGKAPMLEDEQTPLFDWDDLTIEEIYRQLYYLSSRLAEWEDDLLGATVSIFAFDTDAKQLSHLTDSTSFDFSEEELAVAIDQDEFMRDFLKQRQENDANEPQEEWNFIGETQLIAGKEDLNQIINLTDRIETHDLLIALAIETENDRQASDYLVAQRLVDEAHKEYGWLDSPDFVEAPDGNEDPVDFFEAEQAENRKLERELELFAIEKMIQQFSVGKKESDDFLKKMLKWLFEHGEPETSRDFITMFMEINVYDIPIDQKNIDRNAQRLLFASWYELIEYLTGAPVSSQHQAFLVETAARFNVQPRDFPELFETR